MLALLPLDDRPCNTRFPQQIAAIGGDELRLPPQEMLGRFHTPGRFDPLERWLFDLPPVEALIVSVDMLAYGGLVASRSPRVAVGEALARLDALRQFRARRPGVPVYAFNILMRLAITMDSDEAIANYYNMMRYARLKDEAERFDSPHLRDELAKVTEEIPRAVLDEYLAARARNHHVNAQMIEWLHEGVFDYLLITQEDATEFGLHRQEQARLLARVQERDVSTKMSLHPGADEAALTLLARHWNTGARFRAHWSSREDARRIAPFEDRPYDEALAQHVAAMRGALKEESDDADFQLFINAPVGGSQKDETPEERTARAARLLPFARELESLAATGRVALCDVAFPNGADNVLMTELEKRGVLSRLAVYGGWNTAGNTTGTVLAQCAALANAERGARSAEETTRNIEYATPNAEATASNSGFRAPRSAFDLNRQFVFERLVDDWFYQSQVRARIEKAAREQGLSPLNMNGANSAGGAGDGAAPLEAFHRIEAQARRELRGFAQLLAKRHFNTTLQSSEISLPWARSFEADVRVELA